MKLAATFQRHAFDGDTIGPDMAEPLGPTQLISDADGSRLLFVARHVTSPQASRGHYGSHSKVKIEQPGNFLIVTQSRKTFYTVSLLIGAADVLCTGLLLSVAADMDGSRLVAYCVLTIVPSVLFVAACMASSPWLVLIALCSETLNIFSLFVVTTNSLLLRLIFPAIEILILLRHRSYVSPSLYTL